MQASGRCATQQTWRQWNEIRLLTFAVLLLRGARLGDILGQPNLFSIGLAVFSSAALLSRHAGDGAMLPSVAAVGLVAPAGARRGAASSHRRSRVVIPRHVRLDGLRPSSMEQNARDRAQVGVLADAH